MKRILFAITLCFALGLLMGPLIYIIPALSDRWIRGWDWPSLDSEMLLGILVFSIPVGLNAAIGAGISAKRGTQKLLAISVLPASLHVLAFLGFVDGFDGFLFAQLIALICSVIIWTAGRVGQMIGFALRSEEPIALAPMGKPHA